MSEAPTATPLTPIAGEWSLCASFRDRVTESSRHLSENEADRISLSQPQYLGQRRVSDSVVLWGPRTCIDEPTGEELCARHASG